MSHPPRVMGVDVGTSALKTVLLDESGRILAHAQAPLSLKHGAGALALQPVEDWFEAMWLCCAEMARTHPLKDLIALAFSGQGGTFIPCSAQFEPLGPALSWMDRRAGEEAEWLNHCHTDRLGTIKRIFYPSGVLPKLLWFSRHQPAIYEMLRRICQPNDFLAQALTGRWVSDINTASYLDCFNMDVPQWEPSYFPELELEERLPELSPSGQPIGQLLPDWSDRLGLPPRTLVVAGGHDQACTWLACSPPGSQHPILCTGTAWLIFGSLADTSTVQGLPEVFQYWHLVPQQRAQYLAFEGGALVDRWLEARLAAGESLEHARHRHYEALEQPDSYLAHNYLDFIAQLRAVCVATRDHLRAFGSVNHEAGQPLRVAGGATRSSFWMHLLADELGMPLEFITDQPAAAYGAAITAGIGAGLWNWRHYPTLEVSTSLEPAMKRP